MAEGLKKKKKAPNHALDKCQTRAEPRPKLRCFRFETRALEEAFRRLRLAVQSARQDESSLYQVGLGEVARAANVFIPHFFKQTQLFFQHVFMWNSNLKKKK